VKKIKKNLIEFFSARSLLRENKGGARSLRGENKFNNHFVRARARRREREKRRRMKPHPPPLEIDFYAPE